MKIVLGSDHAGYALKKAVIEHLRTRGVDYEDLGTLNALEAVSYVSYGRAVAQSVQKSEKETFGIVICGTGLGISMTANKYRGVRAALCCNEYMARMARQHNNANVLAMGGRVIGPALAVAIVDAFLSASFESGGRHQVRVDEIDQTEQENFQQ